MRKLLQFLFLITASFSVNAQSKAIIEQGRLMTPFRKLVFENAKDGEPSALVDLDSINYSAGFDGIFLEQVSNVFRFNKGRYWSVNQFIVNAAYLIKNDRLTKTSLNLFLIELMPEVDIFNKLVVVYWCNDKWVFGLVSHTEARVVPWYARLFYLKNNTEIAKQ